MTMKHSAAEVFKNSQSAEEIFADHFARALLMPKDDFLHCVHIMTMAQLEERYGVERRRVEERIADLWPQISGEPKAGPARPCGRGPCQLTDGHEGPCQPWE